MDDPGALIFPTERNCLDDKPANAAISQVFKHLIHLGGDTETARLAFTLVLPLLQPSPWVPKANQCPAGKCPAWGQCSPLAGARSGDICTLRGWLLGYQQPLATPLLMQEWAIVLSQAAGTTPPLQGKPCTPAPTHSPVVQGFARTMARRQLRPRSRQMNEHKARYLTHTKKAPRLPACRFTQLLFTFPASWTLSWSLSQLGGNNLPSYLTQKDSQLSAHKQGLCLSLNESSVN